MNPGRQTKPKKGANKSTANGKGPYSSFYSIHPTQEVKEYLNGGNLSLEDALDALDDRVQNGFKVSLGYSDKNNACYAIIREGNKDWDVAKSAGSFHRDLSKAVLLLAHFLTTDGMVWPEELGQIPEQMFDW